MLGIQCDVMQLSRGIFVPHVQPRGSLHVGAPQDNDSNALSPGVAIGRGIERLAGAIRRNHAAGEQDCLSRSGFAAYSPSTPLLADVLRNLQVLPCDTTLCLAASMPHCTCRVPSKRSQAC